MKCDTLNEKHVRVCASGQVCCLQLLTRIGKRRLRQCWTPASSFMKMKWRLDFRGLTERMFSSFGKHRVCVPDAPLHLNRRLISHSLSKARFHLGDHSRSLCGLDALARQLRGCFFQEEGWATRWHLLRCHTPKPAD